MSLFLMDHGQVCYKFNQPAKLINLIATHNQPRHAAPMQGYRQAEGSATSFKSRRSSQKSFKILVFFLDFKNARDQRF